LFSGGVNFIHSRHGENNFFVGHAFFVESAANMVFLVHSPVSEIGYFYSF